jgi:hypothetical protein
MRLPSLLRDAWHSLAIAEKIIEPQSGQFDPTEVIDRYEEALREAQGGWKPGGCKRAA